MFSLIRITDVIEKMYTLDKIQEEEYRKLVERQFNRYNKLKNQIPKFELMKFIEVIFFMC
jgi:hypothetical protein